MALALEVKRIVTLMVAGRMQVELTIHIDVSPAIAALPQFVLVTLLMRKRFVAILVLRIPDYFVIILRALHPVPISIIVTMPLAVVVTVVFVVAILSFEMHDFDFDDFHNLNDLDPVLAIIEVLEVTTIIAVVIAYIVPVTIIMIMIIGKSGLASYGGRGSDDERGASKFVD
jgi:uncharacterized membrane protein YhaH (DUF805 family)